MPLTPRWGAGLNIDTSASETAEISEGPGTELQEEAVPSPPATQVPIDETSPETLPSQEASAYL